MLSSHSVLGSSQEQLARMAVLSYLVLPMLAPRMTSADRYKSYIIASWSRRLNVGGGAGFAVLELNNSAAELQVLEWIPYRNGTKG